MSNDLTTNKPDEPKPIAPTRKLGGMLESFKSSGPPTYTTLDVASDRGKTLYMKCLTTADRLAKQAVGQELYITDIFLHEIELTDDATGEVYPAVRLVMVEDNGNTISTTSESLIGGWSHLNQVYGKGPWQPALNITIKAVKARKIGEYLQIGSSAQRNRAGGRKASN